MEAGKLRHRITIQSVPVTRSSTGATVVGTPEDFVEVWASVEPISGREWYDAARTNSEVTHRVRMRYYPGITASMRVLFRSRVFDIRSVLNIDERNRELHLMCREMTDATT
jgi:SPP1 family predicted phage head-tail adaptor